MAENSKIEWTDHTINFWWGCEKVAPGCANCYAEEWSRRYGLKLWGPDSVRKRIKGAIPLAHKLNEQATKSGVRYKVFSNSMSDFFERFEGDVVNETAALIGSGLKCLRDEAFSVIDSTSHLDWLLLTKRPENVRRMWPVYHSAPVSDGASTYSAMFRSNVWLGTSISDQATADKAIPELVKCRDLSPVLFLSIEPMLGHVDLSRWLKLIDWVIVGGESGNAARPCNSQLIRAIRKQCEAAGVPCFIKQLGSVPFEDDSHVTGAPVDREHLTRLPTPSMKDRKGGDWNEWPDDLRVRQFPTAKGGEA